MVCPGNKCAFSKACSTYLQNPAQCIFKSQSCTILSWASLVHCKQGDAHLGMQICSRYWNCNKKLFSFPSLPIIFLLDYRFKKCPVYIALVLHTEILGGTSGENQVGGNVKVNDCWRKRGKVVCDHAATVSPGASQVSGSKRLKHTFGQLQRLTPATNRSSIESGSLSIWTDRWTG